MFEDRQKAVEYWRWAKERLTEDGAGAKQPGTPDDDFRQTLDFVLKNIREVLLDKNRKYGNSALRPCRVFSRASAIEQIKVRCDDKISRMMSGQEDDTEDTEFDLLGYLIILRIARLLAKQHLSEDVKDG
jgi:hypothetical protein